MAKEHKDCIWRLVPVLESKKLYQKIMHLHEHPQSGKKKLKIGLM